MAKKSRRNKASYRSRTTKATQQAVPLQPGTAPAAPRTAARATPKAEEPADRYQHVKPELKRIGVIAGAMILVLIILSLVLPYIPHW